VTIQLEFYQLVMIVVSIVAGFWALAKVIGLQIDAKFKAITEHLRAQDVRLTALEQQVTDLRVELARDYVHHNDYTRDIGTLASKFEALAINVERMLHEMTKETLKMIERANRK
jgi:hypothetical protein